MNFFHSRKALRHRHFSHDSPPILGGTDSFTIGGRGDDTPSFKIGGRVPPDPHGGGAHDVMALSHSSACIERIFTQVNLVKKMRDQTNCYCKQLQTVYSQGNQYQVRVDDVTFGFPQSY